VLLKSPKSKIALENNQMADSSYENRDLKALQQSLKFFETVFRASADGIVVTNASQMILQANEAFCDYLGKQQSDVVETNLTTWLDYAGPDLTLRWAELEERVQTGKTPLNDEFLFTVQNEARYFSVNASLVGRIGGEDPGTTISIWRDISEQKHAEKSRDITIQLLGQFNKTGGLRELIANVTLLMQKWSGCEAVGIRLMAGDDYPYYETRGFPAEFIELENCLCAVDAKGSIVRDCKGLPVLECMCGNIIRGRFDPKLPFFTEFGSFWSNSTTALLASTSEEDRQVRARNYCNKAGYETVVLIPLRRGEQEFGLLQFNDHRRNQFTREKVELFEQLADSLTLGLFQKQTTDKLRERESFLDSLLNAIPIPVFYKGRNGRYLGVNRTFETFFGQTYDQLIGKTVFNINPPELAKVYQAKDDELFENGGIQQYESQVRDANGELHDVIFNKAVFHDSHENVIGLVGTILDLTDRKRIEKELQKAQKLESIGLLAGGIAHDFNNLLTGVFMNVSMAKMKLSNDHPAVKTLNKAEMSIDRASSLTSRLLTFAEGGDPVKEATSLRALVQESALFDLSGSKVKPAFDCPDGLWVTELDKNQIHHVISNLTINAREAMPERGMLHITMRNREVADGEVQGLKMGKYVTVALQDSGTGIGPQHLSQIFDPYFSTKQMGSGLGLATVYSIISKHNGHIDVESELNQGSTFTIYLPASEAEQLPQSSESQSLSPAPGVQTKILLMDDETMLLNAVGDMLRDYGFTVETADDGQKAFEHYQKALTDGKPFDLTILDLTVPGGMGGVETVKEILKIAPDARVIVSSGYANDPVLANYTEYGFKGVVTKPYLPKEVLRIIDETVDCL